MNSEDAPTLRVLDYSKKNFDKVVEGLGRICVAFQRLETHLKGAIRLLIDPDDWRLGTIITAQLSFPTVLDVLFAVYHHRFKDSVEAKEFEELKEFLGKCLAANNSRNQIIHSHWMPDLVGQKGAVRTKFTAKNRKELKQQRETVSPGDLEKIAAEFETLRSTFVEQWVDRVHRYVNQRVGAKLD